MTGVQTCALPIYRLSCPGEEEARPVARRSRVVWTEAALDDLDRIAQRIALDKPSAARKLVARGHREVGRLARFPDSGRVVAELPDRPYREVIVGPCRIFYRREGPIVYVVHVV